MNPTQGLGHDELWPGPSAPGQPSSSPLARENAEHEIAARSVALGVYQHGAPWEMGPLDEFEQHAKRPVDIVMWYQDWATTAEIDVGLLARVAARGALPMLTWEPWDHQSPALTKDVGESACTLDRIAAGGLDDYIRESARRLAEYGGPLLLRWAHEMNGDWYPWGVAAHQRVFPLSLTLPRQGGGDRWPGASSEAYCSAWRRMWDLFQEEGAMNVTWVWSPNILDHCAPFEPFYPGDEYVDWLALDGYNWGGWGRWRSFSQLFAPSYARLAALGPQPIMVAETACAEAGGNKARWITEALTRTIPNDFPRVRAVVWFNQQKERDWRIESSPRSEHAFAAAVATAPFLPHPN
jgi:hypothetical protein